MKISLIFFTDDPSPSHGRTLHSQFEDLDVTLSLPLSVIVSVIFTWDFLFFASVAICVILCRPSSEISSQALSVFNKSGLLDVVVQCLERHTHNVELAISAGWLK